MDIERPEVCLKRQMFDEISTGVPHSELIAVSLSYDCRPRVSQQLDDSRVEGRLEV
jgi:hypothetical protein